MSYLSLLGAEEVLVKMEEEVEDCPSYVTVGWEWNIFHVCSHYVTEAACDLHWTFLLLRLRDYGTNSCCSTHLMDGQCAPFSQDLTAHRGELIVTLNFFGGHLLTDWVASTGLFDLQRAHLQLYKISPWPAQLIWLMQNTVELKFKGFDKPLQVWNLNKQSSTSNTWTIKPQQQCY